MVNNNFFRTITESFSNRSVSHQSMKSLKKLTFLDYVKRYIYLLRKYLMNFVGIILNPYKMYQHLRAIRIIKTLGSND